jgi:transposase InsO family protein
MAKWSNIFGLNNKFEDMTETKAQIKFNPYRYHLSSEARKRLKWLYVIYEECDGNIKQAANKLGLSRTWLSQVHGQWLRGGRDPRLLEPESRAPKNTHKRQRISLEKKKLVIEARKEYHWGKDKLATVIERDNKIKIGATTINRYLNKAGLIDVKISNRLKAAHQSKVMSRQKCRPPGVIKDYRPGALIEKDMKLISKMGASQGLRSRDSFWYQHTVIDSFTRIRTLGLAEDCGSQTAVAVQTDCVRRLPFNIACANTDNGSENGKDFDEYLGQNNIIHFYSRSGTPTDNPRVERSHLTDELEFYQHGNICQTFAEQKQRMAKWEYIYNYVRPHQALGNLTPMEFHALYKQNPDSAYALAEKWKAYLLKQSRRLAVSRQIKGRGKIAKLMEQIDLKLASNDLMGC